MKRQQKHPDTRYFHWYNANSHNKYTDDCVIRALSVALNQPWEKTFMDLCEIGCKYGLMPNDRKCYERYLKEKGWSRQNQPRKDDNTKYTGEDFCELLQNCEKVYQYVLSISEKQADNIIAHIGGHHIVAIQNGKVVDTWNSSDRCIGNYWTKGDDNAD